MVRSNPYSFWDTQASKCEFNVSKLAQITNVSVRHLERLFYEDFCRSPKTWLNEQRMITARYLLFEGRTIKDVSSLLDFQSVHHFSSVFKRIYGIPPKKFVSQFAPQLENFN